MEFLILSPRGRGMTKLVRSLTNQLIQSNEKIEGEERTFEKDDIPESCRNCKYFMDEWSNFHNNTLYSCGLGLSLPDKEQICEKQVKYDD